MYLGNQTTIINEISFFGTTKNSKKTVNVKFLPTAANSGIIFKRTDLKKNNEIKANFENIQVEKDILVLKNEAGTAVYDFEQIIIALWACRIDNVIVELDGDSLPYIDGTSEPIIFLLNSSKSKELSEIRNVFRIEKEQKIKKGEFKITAKPSLKFIVNLTAGDEKFEFDNKILPFKEYLSKINEKSKEKIKYDVSIIIALIFLSGKFCTIEFDFEGFDKELTIEFLKKIWNQ